jgi:hypothetical protein
VDAHLDGGTLWAGPDAPEVYYLSGAQNPTRTVYEFLRAPGSANQEREAPWRRPDVRVVVVNSRPLFSETLGPETLSLLEEAFPGSRELDPFLIRWRDR